MPDRGCAFKAAKQEERRECTRSHWKHVREEIGERAQRDEPGPDGRQDPTAPPLHAGHVGPQRIDEPLLCGGDGRSQSEHQGDDHQGRHTEGEHSGGCAAESERMSGQTGQYGTRSAGAGQQIPKSEQGGTGQWL